jgi:hypothetical protein
MFVNGRAIAVQGLSLYRRQICREIRGEHEADCMFTNRKAKGL